MSRNDTRENYTKIKSVIIISLAGILISLLLILAESLLVLSAVLPEKLLSEHGAKFALIIGVIISTLILRMQGRGGVAKKALICSGVIWCVLALISLACNEDASIWAVFFSMLISIFTAFILSIPKNKNSKMHKRRGIR